jgi:hypothetical protein
MHQMKKVLKEAAKAAGYVIYSQQNGKLNCGDGSGKNFHWNPLMDDGDAFRLMVNLRIRVLVGKNGSYAMVVVDKQERKNFTSPSVVWCSEKVDIRSATRQSIVLAAAEIGKRISCSIVGDVSEDTY